MVTTFFTNQKKTRFEIQLLFLVTHHNKFVSSIIKVSS